MKGRNPDPQGNPNYTCQHSPVLAKDRVQIPPNYDAKRQTGMESAQPPKSPIGRRGR